MTTTLHSIRNQWWSPLEDLHRDSTHPHVYGCVGQGPRGQGHNCAVLPKLDLLGEQMEKNTSKLHPGKSTNGTPSPSGGWCRCFSFSISYFSGWTSQVMFRGVNGELMLEIGSLLLLISEILHHWRFFRNLLWKWGILHINWCRISSMNRILRSPCEGRFDREIPGVNHEP